MIKKLFLFLCLINAINGMNVAAPLATAQEGNPQAGAQWGRLTIHNTLAEPIEWKFSTVIHAPNVHPRLDNQERTDSDTLQPGNLKLLSTGIDMGGNILYGTSINLFIKKASQVNNLWWAFTLTRTIGKQTIDLKQLLEDCENKLKHKIQ